jgi:hypothetical protein
MTTGQGIFNYVCTVPWDLGVLNDAYFGALLVEWRISFETLIEDTELKRSEEKS